ncbi:MAG: glycosyltransferase family 4 protein [Candidatus Nanopelagicaceae bacterium]|jgi:phosphatidylinositol alpha-mannosyltransferase
MKDSRRLKVGLVSPYGWDSPGGVQVHIRDLARYLIAEGHEVSVLAPVDDESSLTDEFVTPAGKPIPIPYNGAVARVLFGPVAASRVRQWIAQNDFDLLHIHEPAIPSLGLLACSLADGPMVGTFHVAAERIRIAFAIVPIVEPIIERLRARIAVSEVARATLRNHIETDAVVIPNGIDVDSFRGATPRLEWQLGKTIGFIGRFGEKRKGLMTLIEAIPQIVKRHPDLRVLVAGPGDASELYEQISDRDRPRFTFLGLLSDEEKRQFFKSVDLYVAPNTGGESFGIILAEAMATGTPILASDLDAFRYVLEDGKWGALFETGNSSALAEAASDLLDDPARLEQMAAKSPNGAERFDWRVVATAILDVYEYVTPPKEDGTFEKVRLISEQRGRSRISLPAFSRHERSE